MFLPSYLYIAAQSQKPWPAATQPKISRLIAQAQTEKMLVITIANPVVTLVGLVGNILSAMVVLAPVPTFYRICKKRSTESFKSAPYVVGLFSAMMWTYYGILTHDILLLTINIGVCFVQLIYLTIFIIYAPKKAKIQTVKLMALLNVGVVGCVVLFSILFIKGKKRTPITGGICASFAVSVFVAPLSIIRVVVTTKSVEYMPFSLSFFLTLSAIAWLSYGILIRDIFIAMPNVVGLLFGVGQIILYMMYMNGDKNGAASASEGEQVASTGGVVMTKDHIQLAETKKEKEKSSDIMDGEPSRV